MLYKSGVEYGDYAMNYVQGCAHGCKYPCYAMGIAKRTGKVKDYAEWTTPKIVSNTLNLLDKEIPKLKGKIRDVQLCFTTDPFMYNFPEVSELSIKVIERLNAAGIKAVVLTKGLLPPELADLDRINEYGISLVSLDESFRAEYEPGAAPYQDRIASLYKLHKLGCQTWVSIEPYPTPNIVSQSLEDILTSVAFVNKIVFGRLNYNSKVGEYKDFQSFYNEATEQVIRFCKSMGIAYHIKDGTYKPVVTVAAS